MDLSKFYTLSSSSSSLIVPSIVITLVLSKLISIPSVLLCSFILLVFLCTHSSSVFIRSIASATPPNTSFLVLECFCPKCCINTLQLVGDSYSILILAELRVWLRPLNAFAEQHFVMCLLVQGFCYVHYTTNCSNHPPVLFLLLLTVSRMQASSSLLLYVLCVSSSSTFSVILMYLLAVFFPPSCHLSFVPSFHSTVPFLPGFGFIRY